MHSFTFTLCTHVGWSVYSLWVVTNSVIVSRLSISIYIPQCVMAALNSGLCLSLFFLFLIQVVVGTDPVNEVLFKVPLPYTKCKLHHIIAVI